MERGLLAPLRQGLDGQEGDPGEVPGRLPGAAGCGGPTGALRGLQGLHAAGAERRGHGPRGAGDDGGAVHLGGGDGKRGLPHPLLGQRVGSAGHAGEGREEASALLEGMSRPREILGTSEAFRSSKWIYTVIDIELI